MKQYTSSLMALSSLLIFTQQAQAQSLYPAPDTTPATVAYYTPHEYNQVSGETLQGDIMTDIHNVGSQSACREECDDKPGCIAIAWQNNRCRLMSFVRNQRAPDHDQNGSTHLMAQRQWKRYDNYRIDGADLWSYGAQSDDDCRRTCGKTLNCMAVDYDWGTKNCALKSNAKKMLSSSRVTFLRSALNNDDGGFSFFDEMLDIHGPLERKDKLVSEWQKGGLSITADGRLLVNWLGLPAILWGTDVSKFGVRNDGKLLVVKSDGSSEAFPTSGGQCGEASAGSWRLTIDDDLNIRTVRSNGNVCFSGPSGLTTDVDFWAWKDVMDVPRDGWGNYPVWEFGPNGSNSHIYVIDSGISNSWDATGKMMGRFESLAPVSQDGNSDRRDFTSHGSSVFHVAKNHAVGVLYSGRIVSVKMTDGTGINSNSFSERAVVRAMRTVHDHASSWATTIVNFSGFFPNGAAKVDCAIQWLFYKNIAVFRAAGNSNTQPSRNVYAFTVGAYDKPSGLNTAQVSAFSGFGSGVDLWAPGSHINALLQGTSVATPYASIAAGMAAAKYTSLKQNPGRLYRYLVQSSRNDIVASSQSKTHRNGKRSINMKPFHQSTTVNPDNTDYLSSSDRGTDFCAQFNLPKSNPTSANWDSLINTASPTWLGSTVNGGGTGTGCTKPGCRP